MATCIFCAIARGEGDARYVHRDDRVVAIEDLGPVAPVHVLVIPVEHFETVREITDPALLARMHQVAHRIADERGLAESGYRLVFNIGRDGGQTVPHVHLHLLGGRAMAWPPG
ncbi:MAG: histidine triad nucleotide-binding protein [Candidatus Dormibacteraceae bacterium]